MRINGTLALSDPYIPQIMLDAPNGVLLTNAPAGAGVEVYATNVQTRYVVDWDAVTQRVQQTRVQVVAKNSTTGTIKVKIRDITNGVDVDSVDVTGTPVALHAGPWTNFQQPRAGDITYAVFVEGDGVMDPTVYSVLWEWRGPTAPSAA